MSAPSTAFPAGISAPQFRGGRCRAGGAARGWSPAAGSASKPGSGGSHLSVAAHRLIGLTTAPTWATSSTSTWTTLLLFLFWLMNMWIIYRGIESIKQLENWAAPFLLLLDRRHQPAALGVVKVGSMGDILDASYLFTKDRMSSSGKSSSGGLTAMVGFCTTLSLGTFLISPPLRQNAERPDHGGRSSGFRHHGVVFIYRNCRVTSATVIIFGEPIWDPVVLLVGSNPLVVATIHDRADDRHPVHQYCRQRGGACQQHRQHHAQQDQFPNGRLHHRRHRHPDLSWKLLADPHGYIFVWLIAYSATLGALVG